MDIFIILPNSYIWKTVALIIQALKFLSFQQLLKELEDFAFIGCPEEVGPDSSKVKCISCATHVVSLESFSILFARTFLFYCWCSISFCFLPMLYHGKLQIAEQQNVHGRFFLFIKAYDCYDKRISSQKERQKNLAEQLKMFLEELEKYAAKVCCYML